MKGDQPPSGGQKERMIAAPPRRTPASTTWQGSADYNRLSLTGLTSRPAHRAAQLGGAGGFDYDVAGYRGGVTIHTALLLSPNQQFTMTILPHRWWGCWVPLLRRLTGLDIGFTFGSFYWYRYGYWPYRYGYLGSLLHYPYYPYRPSTSVRPSAPWPRARRAAPELRCIPS
jgi:hypothetical protein